MTEEHNERFDDFIRLYTRHERQLRAFVFGLVVSRDAVDEIMQEVSVVLWKKFTELKEPEGFLPWASVIARYEVLMYRRKYARDRLVFDESVLLQLADEHGCGIGEEASEQLLQDLSSCLQRLPDRDRKLLRLAYCDGNRLTNMATDMGVTANALSKSLGRLRRRLRTCIESRTANAG